MASKSLLAIRSSDLQYENMFVSYLFIYFLFFFTFFATVVTSLTEAPGAVPIKAYKSISIRSSMIFNDK